MRIAIVGTGVSGLVCAHLLSRRHDVTVFEADGRPGGHAHTVTRRPGRRDSYDVDTGFLVYNERNYPGLVRAVRRARGGHQAQRHELQRHRRRQRARVEGHLVRHRVRPATQPGPPVLPAHAGRRRPVQPDGPGAARRRRTTPRSRSADLLERRAGGRPQFLDWYLVPMGSSIWSADPVHVPRHAGGDLRPLLRQPRAARVRQPARRGGPWTAGPRRYVDAIAGPARRGRAPRRAGDKVTRSDDGVELHTDDGPERFDHVVMATHSDQALDLLSDPHPAEREVLGAIRYQPNRATLHTDVSLLPTEPPGLGQLELPPAGRPARAGHPHLPAAQPAGDRLRRRAAGHPQPRRRHRPDQGAPHGSTTPIRSTTSPPSPPSGATRSSTASDGPGSAAPTGATASTRTASRAPWSCAGAWPARTCDVDGPTRRAPPTVGPTGRTSTAGPAAQRHLRGTGRPPPVRPRSTTASPTGSPWSPRPGRGRRGVRLHPLWTDGRAQRRDLPPGRLPG